MALPPGGKVHLDPISPEQTAALERIIANALPPVKVRKGKRKTA
jgi:hypothetical protein